MKRMITMISVVLLCACGSTSVPEWKDRGYTQLENYKIHFLSGKEDAAEPHFIKARREIAASNDLNLLAVAYLTKYALHTASLEHFDAADFAKLHRLEPNPANMTYCHFLKGNFSAVDVTLLPASYTDILKAALNNDSTIAVRALAAIDDPLSRLIACGVWTRYLPANMRILQIAISTASEQGWRRPLWAYLASLQSYYEEQGELANAMMVKERLELLKK